MGFAMEGVLLGNAQDMVGKTGCTVVLLPKDSVCGVEVRGLAPGTRETALLDSLFTVSGANAILLTGGSAYGLAAADGVMRYLEERGVGYPTPAGPVPIVPAAVIYDLAVGDPSARPDAAMGYQACLEAGPELCLSGPLGVGTGATVGKVLGMQWCSEGGLGTACLQMSEGVKVFALAVVNAFGDVVDERGEIIAGARSPQGGFLDTAAFLLRTTEAPPETPPPGTNTTLGVILTDARLSKVEVNLLARAGHHGIAKATSPSHTRWDGDTVFAASVGEREAPVELLMVAAAELMARAVRNAVRS